jgi:predicted nucleic acid-binding protein
MKYVLDSCALIAFIRDEEGAAMIEQILLDGSAMVMMHALNVCEVYYDCLRVAGKEHAERIVASLVSGNVIIREDMDAPFWKFAGTVKAGGRISLADTFAVALAAREEAVLLTSDHHEFDPFIARGDYSVQIRFIR